MIALPHAYEACLRRGDGRPSILMHLLARDDGDARTRVLGMMKGGLAKATLWQDGRLVGSIYKIA